MSSSHAAITPPSQLVRMITAAITIPCLFSKICLSDKPLLRS
ncbi:Uncharacterised protein [Vibrio cholerae]|nr:Uncharacterised protein [Vibrio cholerae]CSI71911.1 Uncharacterised protein [Vibrio cholerae]